MQLQVRAHLPLLVVYCQHHSYTGFAGVQVNATADQKGYPVLSCPNASVVLGNFNTQITLNSSILEYGFVFFFNYFFSID